MAAARQACFASATAFGYAASERTALSYKGMRESDYCIDVSGSPLYNRIVDARAVGRGCRSAGSTEPMRRDIHADGDIRYKLGFVIEHNTHGAPQARQLHLCALATLRRRAHIGLHRRWTSPRMRALLEWLRPERTSGIRAAAAAGIRASTTWNCRESAAGLAWALAI